MTSQTTNATNMAKITADATSVNSGIGSTNSCTAPPNAPKKNTASGSKTAVLSKVNKAEMKRVKKDLSEEFKAVKKTMAEELKTAKEEVKTLKKEMAEQLKTAKKDMSEELKTAKKTISSLKMENEKLQKTIVHHEKKVASLLAKNTKLLEIKNLHTRPRFSKA